MPGASETVFRGTRAPEHTPRDSSTAAPAAAGGTKAFNQGVKHAYIV